MFICLPVHMNLCPKIPQELNKDIRWQLIHHRKTIFITTALPTTCTTARTTTKPENDATINMENRKALS